MGFFKIICWAIIFITRQLNKERKLNILTAKEQQIEIEENSLSVNYSLILNVVGVAVAVASLYYAIRKSSSSVNPPKVKEEKPAVKEKVTALLLDSLE